MNYFPTTNILRIFLLLDPNNTMYIAHDILSHKKDCHLSYTYSHQY